MPKLTSLIMVVSLALGATNSVHAATDSLTPPPAGHGKIVQKVHVRGGPMEMFKKLNLTDEQKQQMRDILKQQRQMMKRPSADEIRQKQAIITADHFDKDKASALAADMTANAKERVVAMMETQNKLYNLLTAEQKKQYSENVEKHFAEMKKHKGKMMTPME
ncbi:ATP-independent periplasmic protein-refolding chaperone Spy [Enterobacteriaceae bacterium LUAb1]